MSDNPLVALDSQAAKDSPTVAEARHIVREKMLLAALDELFEIGMNRENRPSDRNSALKEVIAFAEGAEGTEGRLLARLRPEAARRLAKLGKDLEDERVGIAKRSLESNETKQLEASGTRKSSPNPAGQVVPDEAQGERLGSGDAPKR